MTTVTVIKTGNSLALRVPKSYAVRNNLRPGAKVVLADPEAIGGTLADLQTSIESARKGIKVWDDIASPTEWQKNERSSWS